MSDHDFVGSLDKACPDCQRVTVMQDYYLPVENVFERVCTGCDSAWVIE